jgi:hypothetical protein
VGGSRRDLVAAGARLGLLCCAHVDDSPKQVTADDVRESETAWANTAVVGHARYKQSNTADRGMRASRGRGREPGHHHGDRWLLDRDGVGSTTAFIVATIMPASFCIDMEAAVL